MPGGGFGKVISLPSYSAKKLQNLSSRYLSYLFLKTCYLVKLWGFADSELIEFFFFFFRRISNNVTYKYCKNKILSMCKR